VNRIALALTLLAVPGLVATALIASSAWLPFGVAIGLTALGSLLALAGAATARTRVHAAGVATALLGVSLTGVGLSTPLLGLGVGSATLLLASLNLHLVLPEDGGGLTLVIAAVLSAALVAAIALGVAQLSSFLGAGGVDAATGVTAWLVLVAAGTWALVRWAREASPG
jgi:hypothetical protein